MRFPTKAKCREWLATFNPHDPVGVRSHPTHCPMANLIRSVIGDMGVRISVVPPVVKLWSLGPGKESMVAQATIPAWATRIIDGVDKNLPPRGTLDVTAAEVSELLGL